MKKKLIVIMASDQTDEKKSEEIIALAVVKDEPRHDDAEKRGDELVALRSVLEILGGCNPSEVTITPKLFWMLCRELEDRAHVWTRAETRAVFSGS